MPITNASHAGALDLRTSKPLKARDLEAAPTGTQVLLYPMWSGSGKSVQYTVWKKTRGDEWHPTVAYTVPRYPMPVDMSMLSGVVAQRAQGWPKVGVGPGNSPYDSSTWYEDLKYHLVHSYKPAMYQQGTSRAACVASRHLTRLAETNQQILEAPHNHHPVKLEPPKKKRKQFPFEGFIDFQGLEIDVENKAGSTRSGTDPDGNSWETKMNYHYGEIRGTEGADGDLLDTYVGENHDSPLVVVIHQHNPWDGKYDECKVMLGFDSTEEAIGAYKKQYDKPGYYKDGEYTEMPMGQFWRWVKDTRNKGKRVKAALPWKYPVPLTTSDLARASLVHWVTITPSAKMLEQHGNRLPGGWNMWLLPSGKPFDSNRVKTRLLSDAEVVKLFKDSGGSTPKISIPGRRALTIGDVTTFLRSMRTKAGGRTLKVYYNDNPRRPSWEVEPQYRQRLDHYGNGGDGWDEDGWNDAYAYPLAAEAQADIDGRFGKGMFSVDIGEKGHIDVQLTTKGIQESRLASTTRVATRHLEASTVTDWHRVIAQVWAEIGNPIRHRDGLEHLWKAMFATPWNDDYHYGDNDAIWGVGVFDNILAAGRGIDKGDFLPPKKGIRLLHSILKGDVPLAIDRILSGGLSAQSQGVGKYSEDPNALFFVEGTPNKRYSNNGAFVVVDLPESWEGWAGAVNARWDWKTERLTQKPTSGAVVAIYHPIPAKFIVAVNGLSVSEYKKTVRRVPAPVETMVKVAKSVHQEQFEKADHLSQVDPAIAKVMTHSGETNEDKISVRKFSGPAASLKPSQSTMVLEDSIGLALTMLKRGKIGGDLGAILSSDKHIMDGHHRWSGAILAGGGTAKVGGYIADLPGSDLVRVLNIVTKSVFRKTQGNRGRGNLSDYTPAKVKALLEGYLADGIGGDYPWTADGIRDVLVKNFGSAEAGVATISSNAQMVTTTVPPWAPPRHDMPVIEPGEVPAAAKVLQRGEVDWKAPYKRADAFRVAAAHIAKAQPWQRRISVEARRNSNSIDISVEYKATESFGSNRFTYEAWPNDIVATGKFVQRELTKMGIDAGVDPHKRPLGSSGSWVEYGIAVYPGAGVDRDFVLDVLRRMRLGK